MGQESFGLWAVVVITFVVLIVATLMFLAARYKRCPSDQVLVIFGKVGEGMSSRCIHGGGAFIWPLIQDYRYLSLTPLSIGIDLRNALSLQNIRINVPSTFTVGVSTHDATMSNAAERLLNLNAGQIEEMAREIIFGQLRLTVASLTIEQINQDRESFLEQIRKNVEPELNKIGLYLINVNITDITDESNYIESIGKKAAAEAIFRARIDVAEQEKIGAIGQSAAQREQQVQVAVNEAEAVKGQKAAQAEQRVFVQQRETHAAIGESEAVRNKDIALAQNTAEATKGKKAAEADQRVFVQQREADAIAGENTARASIALSNAELSVKAAEAHRLSEVASREAEFKIQEAQARVEQQRLTASEVVRQEIERRKVEIQAAAEAEQTRLRARGDADATKAKYEAEAEGVRKVLQSKADGYRALVESCGGDARAAASLLMIEKIEHLVDAQVAAIQNLKIDKVTVWDAAGGQNGSSTANFASSLIKSLPPLHEVAKMAGVDLPEYLGQVSAKENGAPQKAR
ncbi:MAG TPA: SPFH domain-containing protein [Polyangiales bacterium]|nr:SPFH domain-containing protein [Polyangiales bacterium]